MLDAQQKQHTPAQKQADDAALATEQAAEEEISRNEEEEKIRQIAALEDILCAEDKQYFSCKEHHCLQMLSNFTGFALTFSVAVNVNCSTCTPQLLVQQCAKAPKMCQAPKSDDEDEDYASLPACTH